MCCAAPELRGRERVAAALQQPLHAERRVRLHAAARGTVPQGADLLEPFLSSQELLSYSIPFYDIIFYYFI